MIKIISPDHLVIQAPSKLNLHLDVGGPREDGFHSLVSLFQMVSLCDRMEFKRISESGIYIKGDFNFPQEQNIIYKAVMSFCSKAGIEPALEIIIDKNIPQGGGMGGGSGNAAATLAACSFLYSGLLDKNELFLLAESLGSDVPFFLGGAAAVVSGRGEILESVKSRTDYCFLVIRPDFSIGTGEAFSLLDRGRDNDSDKFPEFDSMELKRKYKELPPDEWGFFNSFLSFLNNSYPALDIIIKYLYDSGSEFSGLTGSGSCVFGVFRNMETAEKALEQAKKKFSYAKFVVPLDISPYHILI